MNIGDKIQSYEIITIVNGYAMGKSPTAPSPYAVWQIDNNGKGVCCGHYFVDREEAEWSICARAFNWFEDNMYIHVIENNDHESDQCNRCRYNTNDVVCHPHCGGCNGNSRFERRTSEQSLEHKMLNGLNEIKASMVKAAQLVDEMCEEMDRQKERRSHDNIEYQRL